MGLLIKLSEIRKGLSEVETRLSEANSLCKADAVSDERILKILNGLSENTMPIYKELKDFLEDKESIIEELEFLTGGFRLEYGSILDYRKFSSIIANKELKEKLRKFGKEEAAHAEEFSKFINKYDAKPEYTFVMDRSKEEIEPEKIFDYLIEQEKDIIHFYQQGEERFQDAEFCWMLGKIKLEEKDHLKELEGLKKEYEETEVRVSVEPNFKWIDPFMGEPGDRPWTE